MPSVKDVHHDPLYPQPPFDADSLPKDVQDKVTCLPNPSMISCQGVSIAMTSHDILKHLSGTELHRSTTASDRMARLALHTLQQRTFYPLYPPFLGSCLDTGIALQGDSIFLPETPNLLVLPSGAKMRKSIFF